MAQTQCFGYRYIIQVKEKFKRDIAIGIVEKQRKQARTLVCIYNRAITVLHEQWMCRRMQTHPHHTI